MMVYNKTSQADFTPPTSFLERAETAHEVTDHPTTPLGSVSFVDALKLKSGPYANFKIASFCVITESFTTYFFFF